MHVYVYACMCVSLHVAMNVMCVSWQMCVSVRVCVCVPRRPVLCVQQLSGVAVTIVIFQR